jgi:hypothetical protein
MAMHLVDVGQAVDQRDGLVGVGAVVGDHQLEFAAGPGFAAGVDLVDGHLQALDGSGTHEGVDTRQRDRHADRDFLGSGGRDLGGKGDGSQQKGQFHGESPREDGRMQRNRSISGWQAEGP